SGCLGTVDPSLRATGRGGIGHITAERSFACWKLRKVCADLLLVAMRADPYRMPLRDPERWSLVNAACKGRGLPARQTQSQLLVIWVSHYVSAKSCRTADWALRSA